MADLISREAAIEAMRECWRRGHQFAKLFEANRVVDCIQAVKQMPAVDAAPVVHARWTTERTWKHDGEWYCSACEYEPVVFMDSSYCPNCGAKMRDDE